jgi:endonuclease YncB( thermonuclease family)
VRTLIPILLLAASFHASGGETFTARVVAVHDGDTITVEAPGHVYKVRLFGIDCPELRQPGGDEAKWFTHDAAIDRTVRVTETDTDRYGRMVAVVTLTDGRVLNHALVRAGHAWWLSKYAPNDTDLQTMEAEAREESRGLWAEANPLPPWEWRKVRYPVAENARRHGARRPTYD